MNYYLTNLSSYRLFANTPELTCLFMRQMLGCCCADEQPSDISRFIHALLCSRYNRAIIFQTSVTNSHTVELLDRVRDWEDLRLYLKIYVSFYLHMYSFYNLARALDGKWNRTDPLLWIISRARLKSFGISPVCLSTGNLNKKLVPVLWGANKWPCFPFVGCFMVKPVSDRTIEGFISPGLTNTHASIQSSFEHGWRLKAYERMLSIPETFWAIGWGWLEREPD